MKTLLLIAAIAWGPEAAPPVADGAATTADTPLPQVAQLVEQHARLLEEVEQMRREIERLSRATRENGAAIVVLDDLDPMLAALSSESFQERTEATATLRRSLVNRMWLLVETPELTPEAIHRLKSILVETSAMIRLTSVAVDLQGADRDALWNLLDADPEWVISALGDDPDQIKAVLAWPPAGHEHAAEIVLAALVRDELRPVPQILALGELETASSPLLRDALRSLLMREPQAASHSTIRAQRQKAAVLAVTILARHPSPDLIGFLLACLKSAKSWNMRVDFTIVEALVGMGAREAAGELLTIALKKRGQVRGQSRYMDILVKPGDCELVGAALLLGMDLDELQIKSRSASGNDTVTYYGFTAAEQPENPDRVAALTAIEKAVEQVAPFAPIDGYDEALDQLADK
jgi:hypothetical protein